MEQLSLINDLPKTAPWQPMVWNIVHRWEPQIRSALRHNHALATFDDLLDKLMKAEMVLFFNEEGFAICQMYEIGNKRWVAIIVAGGNQQSLYDLEPQAAAWGKQHGATKMTILGREGFKKRLYQHGWHSPSVYFEKEI